MNGFLNYMIGKKDSSQKKPHYFSYLTFMMLLTALSIDTILPALSLIRQEFYVKSNNEIQYVISFLFLGFMIGQLGFGSLSDAIGRKKTVRYGLCYFILGTVICLTSDSLWVLLAGRFIQGFGAACLRVMSVAITRDLYSGSQMARVMSLLIMMLILIPVIAPTLGQIILIFGGWRDIFIFFLVISSLAMIWIEIGLHETLPAHKRQSFFLSSFVKGVKRMFFHPLCTPHIICAGLLFGIMVLYVSTAQQIFQDYFRVGDKFALYFGTAALSIGGGSFSNSILVKKYQMDRVLHFALLGMVLISLIGFVACLSDVHLFSLPVFMGYLMILFYFMGLCFGNVNTLVMQPMGDIAGIASAILGFTSTAISLVVGVVVGQMYHHNIMPFIATVFVLGSASFIIRYFSQKAYEKSLKK